MSSISPAVKRVAQRIRLDVLNAPDGQLLGSEDDLVQRYGVSRPTLRQAASILSQEQLLVVKRGVGGGYLTRRPDAKGVVHAAAVYLLAHATSVQEILDAIGPIQLELVALACRSDNDDLIGELEGFAFQFDEIEFPSNGSLFDVFVESERDFSEILRDISGNKVLSLFMATLYDFSSELPEEYNVFFGHDERIVEFWNVRAKLARAIIARDQEISLLHARRCIEMIANWSPQGDKLVPLDIFKGIFPALST
jgi:GntR family transcriptional regulator, transcriptional repressor for pyruvate dehydrogenase complex